VPASNRTEVRVQLAPPSSRVRTIKISCSISSAVYIGFSDGAYRRTCSATAQWLTTYSNRNRDRALRLKRSVPRAPCAGSRNFLAAERVIQTPSTVVSTFARRNRYRLTKNAASAPKLGLRCSISIKKTPDPRGSRAGPPHIFTSAKSIRLSVFEWDSTVEDGKAPQ